MMIQNIKFLVKSLFLSLVLLGSSPLLAQTEGQEVSAITSESFRPFQQEVELFRLLTEQRESLQKNQGDRFLSYRDQAVKMVYSYNNAVSEQFNIDQAILDQTFQTARELILHANVNLDKQLVKSYDEATGKFVVGMDLNATLLSNVHDEKEIGKLRHSLREVAREVKFEIKYFHAILGSEAILSAFKSVVNPVSFEQGMQEMTDDPLLTGTQIVAFTVGSEAAQHMMGERMSPSMKMQYGLGFGMLLSMLYTELYNDVKSGDIGKCHWGVYKGLKAAGIRDLPEIHGADAEDAVFPENVEYSENLKSQKIYKKLKEESDQACIDASERWFSKDIYYKYTPDVAALMAAAPLSSYLIQGIGQGSNIVSSYGRSLLSKPAASGFIKGGVKVFKKSDFIRKFGKGALALGRGAVTAGAPTFVILGNIVFMMGGYELLLPIFAKPWNYLNFNHFGFALSEDLKKDRPEHLSHVRSYNENKEKLKWFEESLEEEVAPVPYAECIAKAKERSFGKNRLGKKVFYNTKFDRLKMECEEKSKVKTYSVLDPDLRSIDEGVSLTFLDTCLKEAKEKSSYRLRTGAKGVNKSVLLKLQQRCYLKGNPSSVFDLDYAFFKEHNSIKFQGVEQGKANWTQFVGNFTALHKQASILYNEIAKIKWNHMRSGNKDEYPAGLTREHLYELIEDKKELYPAGKKGIEFTHLVDYLIYQMACGPKLDYDMNNLQSEDLDEFLEVGIVQRSFGASLKLLPPSVIKSKKTVCFSGMNTDIYESLMDEKGAEAHPIFNGAWYNGLDYIIKDEPVLTQEELSYDSEHELNPENVLTPKNLVNDNFVEIIKKDYQFTELAELKECIGSAVFITYKNKMGKMNTVKREVSRSRKEQCLEKAHPDLVLEIDMPYFKEHLLNPPGPSRFFDKDAKRSNGRRYSNLLYFVFDHFDSRYLPHEDYLNWSNAAESESGYVSEDGSIGAGFYSWESHVTPVVERAWDWFESDYLTMMKDDLLPLLYSVEKKQHGRNNAKKRFKSSPNIDKLPRIPALKARVQEKLRLILKTARSLGISNEDFESASHELLTAVVEDLDSHVDWLKSWKNNGKLPVTKEEGSENQFGVNIEYALEDLSDYLGESQGPFHKQYSFYAVMTILQGECTESALSDIFTWELEQRDSIVLMKCSDTELAQQLLLSTNETKLRDEIVKTQIRVLQKELNDYFEIINNLLRTIGIFKDI